MSETYRVNEVFYSLQGEGIWAGTANVFIRFSGCNMRCSVEEGEKSPGGFDCDTEFESGRTVTQEELLKWVIETLPKELIKAEDSKLPSIIYTGGEPALQLDNSLLNYMAWNGCNHQSIETNGSIDISHLNLDWITVSPKVAEHCVCQRHANEVKYVRGYGQALPKTEVIADHYLISPAFNGTHLDLKTLEWCVKLCLENPKWKLSPQLHKLWRVQ